MQKTLTDQIEAPPAVSISRRREIRLEAPAGMKAVGPALRGKTRIENISCMGLCLITDAPFRLSAAFDLMLSWRDISVECRARVVHCGKHHSGWLIGVEFIELQKVQRWSVEDLLNQIVGTAITFC